jgi:two-component sensor histidine kinase
MLALISGLVRLTGGPTVEAYKHALIGRLGALQRANETLSAAGREAADYRALIREEMAAYQIEGRVRIAGPTVRLSAAATRCFAMGLHELATNAVRHGALSTPAGIVEIDWRVTADDLVTTWIESGGPPVSVPSRKGVGSNIVARCVTHQLGGRLSFDWHPQGLRVEVQVPLCRAIE